MKEVGLFIVNNRIKLLSEYENKTDRNSYLELIITMINFTTKKYS